MEEAGLGPGDIVLDGDPDLPIERGTAAPHFSAHVYCGQTIGWIRILLGTEVGLGSGHYVIWVPAPRGEGARFAYAISAIFLFPDSGFRVRASRASFIAVFAICCTRYRVSRPLQSPLTLKTLADSISSFAESGR